MEYPSLLRERIHPEVFRELTGLRNGKLLSFLEEAVSLCQPDSVRVVRSEEDFKYVRERSIELGEEIPLKTRGHTIHFDPPKDQARAREDTFILGGPIPFVNTRPKEQGLREVISLLRGSMRGREMLVGLYSLGPRGSPKRFLAVQVTDSPYVIHSENILYRVAFQDFKGDSQFLGFVHSKGTLDPSRRRIAIDLEDERVYSVNTTYAGNSVGLKKLALRLTINRAVREGWLSEHMAIIGLKGRRGRHYVTASFPSASGKTSTSMMGSLVSDDLAFIVNQGGEPRAWNPEAGVFGIIHGVNETDDQVIWEVLHREGEVIFSNVLMKEDGNVYWQGSGEEVPLRGKNFSGEWWKGKLDEEGNPIPPSHPNARFTVKLTSFRNADPSFDDPAGVPVEGVIFGVRDFSTAVPISEAFSWEHGVLIGASMESARTSAVMGKADEMEFNPMAIIDFMSVDLGKYLENYLTFGRNLRKVPKVFGANYFLKDKEGKFLNRKEDKRVWLNWIVDRIEGNIGALRTPIGLIPEYEDIRDGFSSVLGRDYTREQYVSQFTVRLTRYREKYERIRGVYSRVQETPHSLLFLMDSILRDLDKYIEEFGEQVSPLDL